MLCLIIASVHCTSSSSLFFLLYFSLPMNNKRDLACSEFRNTDTAISCNISSNSYSDMQNSRSLVYIINAIVLESGYVTVFFINPLKNMFSICRTDTNLFPHQTGIGTCLQSKLPCKMELCLSILEVCLHVYPNIVV